MGQQGHRVERRFGDKPERALAAHHEVRQDLDGGVEVDERVERVSHRVLDRKLSHDLVAQLR